MGRNKNISPKEQEYIKVHLAMSEPITEIAAALGRNYYTVFNWAKKMGALKSHQFTPQEDTIIRMMYGKVPAKQIATRLHVTVEQVYNRAKNIGVRKFAKK